MRRSPLLANVILCALLSAAMLTALLLRAFAPHILLPQLNIPNMAALSLLALLAAHCLTPNVTRCCGLGTLYSALTFALLPWLSGFFTLGEALRTGVVGGTVFAAAAWLYSVILQRLRDSLAAPAAPVICALGLYLAAQGLMGILL